MANAWLAHVKKTMKAHKGQKFSAVLKLAKKTYKKGGALPALAPAAAGGRRRTRRTRRSRK